MTRVAASTIAALLSVISFVPTPASAQEADTLACQPVSPTSQVVMTRSDGSKVRGTLLCLGEREVALAGDGLVTRTALVDVARIDKPRDGVNDGFLKGAAIGLVTWAAFCTRCGMEYPLRATLGYAFIGLALDALQGNNKTIYRRAPSASVAWRVRF